MDREVVLCVHAACLTPLSSLIKEDKHTRKMQLERRMMGLPEMQKQELRRVLEKEENLISKENRKKMAVSDFESLAIIGRGAFGEVRLVRRKGKKDDPQTGLIFALKSMKKDMMVVKNQVHHVKAERDALAAADDSNRWLTTLYGSFFDESHLYMCMEFMPGGDLMSLLIKEDTFSEHVTRFFMAEAAQAISSVHALGYIHRDIKPDNMLLNAFGHLKLTDLGLCKKVGEVSPTDDPEVILDMMRRQGISDSDPMDEGTGKATAGGAKHRGSDDAMAMSIDDGIPQAPGQPRDPKTRREVRFVCTQWHRCLGDAYLSFMFADGIFDCRYPGLHCPRGVGRSEWCVRVLVHMCGRLVVPGRHHVRVPCRLYTVLRGRPGHDVPKDPPMASVPGNASGNQGSPIV